MFCTTTNERITLMGFYNKYSVTYLVNMDYDTEINCEEYGCDDYCRCGRLVNMSIDGPIDAQALARDIWKDDVTTMMEFYALLRITTAARLSGDDINFYGVNGYYGEEPEADLNSNSASAIEDKLREFKRLKTLSEQVEFLLVAEYGHLLPVLEGCTWTLETIAVSDIALASSGYTRLDTVLVEEYQASITKASKYKASKAKKPTQDKLIEGWEKSMPQVVLHGDVLLDGQHRLAALKAAGFTETTALVAR